MKNISIDTRQKRVKFKFANIIECLQPVFTADLFNLTGFPALFIHVFKRRHADSQGRQSK